MNKYITMLLGVFVTMLSFSSCTDRDEVEIVYHQTTSVQVLTSNLYESLGITEVQNAFGNGYKAKIVLYIYNSDGSLMIKKVAESIDMKPISFSDIALDRGEYTVLALQYLINDTKEEPWTFEEEENLNTIKVMLNGWGIWQNAIAMDAKQITVKDNEAFNAEPKLLGSIVDFRYENFDKSDFLVAGFWLKNRVVGLSLDPKIVGKDKYFYYNDGFNSDNIWSSAFTTLSTSTSDDVMENLGLESEYSYKTFVLESGETNCCLGVADAKAIESNSFYGFPDLNFYIEFERGKQYVANLYYYPPSGMIETYIGVAEDFNNWFENLPIFDTPCTEWGATVSYVKSYMNEIGYNSDWMDHDLDETGVLLYYGKYDSSNILYNFDLEKKTLSYSAVSIPTSAKSPIELKDIFEKDSNYNRSKTYDLFLKYYGWYVYEDSNSTIIIVPSDNYTDIMYRPLSGSSSKSNMVQKIYNISQRLKSNRITVKGVNTKSFWLKDISKTSFLKASENL